MSKTKSVVITALLTIVIVALCLMCVVPQFGLPFRVNGAYQTYNSVTSVINYGSDLGGGYSAVYYPEGVISAETYNAKVERYTVSLRDELEKGGATVSEDMDYEALKGVYESQKATGDIVEAGKIVAQADEYIESHKAWDGEGFTSDEGKAVLYLEKEEVCFEKDGSYVIGEDFVKDFDATVEAIAKRFDKKNFSFLSVSKVNGYAIRVNVPLTVSNAEELFTQMGYTGDFTLRGADSERPVLQGFGEHKISDYFKSAASRSSGAAGYVVLKLTTLGKDKVHDITAALTEGDSEDKTLYFYVGDTQVIGLGLSDEAIDQRTLYISGESMTAESAENIGIVIDSCINDRVVNLTLSVDGTVTYSVGSGDGAIMAIYIVFGVALLALAIYSIVRYKGLGVVQIFSYLSFLICMLMYIAFLPGMLLHVSGVFAVALTSVILVLSNFYIFENVRKEFNTGKTLEASVKAGYKKSLAAVLDTHILLFILGLILYFISVSEVVTFAYIFTLGILTSGILSLLVTRFYWYSMRGLLPRGQQHKFSGFVREVSDDDED